MSEVNDASASGAANERCSAGAATGPAQGTSPSSSEVALALIDLHRELIRLGVPDAEARVRVLTDPRASNPAVREHLPAGLERRGRGRPPDSNSVTSRATDLAQILMIRDGVPQAAAVREAIRLVPGADAGNVRKYLRKRKDASLLR